MAADDEPTGFAIESTVDDPLPDTTGGDDEKDTKPEETGDPLKDTQRWAHKLNDENRALREKLAELGGKVDLLSKFSQKPPEEKKEEQLPDALGGFKEEDAADLIEDPKKLVGLLRQMADAQTQMLLRVLPARDQHLLTEITKLIPRDTAKDSILAEMRKDPDLKGLDDNVLLIMAKKMGRAEPRGGPGGRRTDGGGDETEIDRLASRYEELIYGKAPKGGAK
jgi:hypothetical protein